MGTFPRVNQIRRVGALTLLGNSQAVEGRAEDLAASEARIILGLATTSDVTFDIVRATTSVQTPLVNNASAALTLGNSTYGVTVPGAMGIYSANTGGKQLEVNGTGDIYLRGTIPTVQFYTAGSSQAYATWYSDKFRVGTWNGAAWRESFIIEKSAPANSLVIASTGAATFSGDISMQKATQGYIRAYSPNGTKQAYFYATDTGLSKVTSSGGQLWFEANGSDFAMLSDGSTNAYFRVFSTSSRAISVTHNNTNGEIGTSYGNLNIVPTGGTVAVTGGITASGNVTLTGSTATVAASTSLLRLTSAATGFEFRPAAGYIEQWTSGSDGQYRIYNSAGSKFLSLDYDTALNRARIAADKICLDANNTTGVVSIGQTGNSGDPGLKRGGVGILSARLGDDSADAAFTCAGITASGSVSYAQGLSTGTVTKSANYTTTADDYCVNVTANSIDITFETAVGCANREHEVVNSGSGVVTLKTTSAQTISGSASGALTLAQWKSIRVKSDGANWLIMSQVT